MTQRSNLSAWNILCEDWERETPRSLKKPLNVISVRKGRRPMHFPLRSHGALGLCHLLFDCFIWLFQCLLSILTLFLLLFFFPLSFYFYLENLSLFYIPLAYEQERWNLLRLARSIRSGYLEMCPDVDRNAKLFLRDDLWDLCSRCTYSVCKWFLTSNFWD